MKRSFIDFKRILSMLLALCMVLSIVAEPGGLLITSVNSVGEDASLISTPVYTHAMDTLATAISGEPYSVYYPEGWVQSYRWNNIKASTIVEKNDGTGDKYYQMKVQADGETRNYLASYTFTQDNAPGANAVLKYQLMVDNSDVAGDWSVMIPILSNGASGRSLELFIKNTETDGIYALTDNHTSIEWREGQWYDVELVVSNNGQAWRLFVNGNAVFSGTKSANYAMTCAHINMGLAYLEGKDRTGVSLCVDNVEVYTNANNATLRAAMSSYTVAVGQNIKPGWKLEPSEAYLPSVTYSSSDELVATVNADTGVVTAVSKGTAVITAKPSASSGLPAATTMVIVKDASDMIEITGVSINNGADAAILAAGNKLTLNATVTPAEATGWNVTWTSQNAAVAKVDADTGVVTGVKSGTTVITATVNGTQISDSIAVTVVGSSGTVSSPIYSNPMDILDAKENMYPLDWDKASGDGVQKANASQIVTVTGDRTYYRMKRDGSEKGNTSWATMSPLTDYSAVVLKYDVMVDNDGLTGWSVYLPELTYQDKGRPIGLTVKDNQLLGSDITLVPGTWYTFELILKNSDWKLYVDGQKAREGTIASGRVISCLNMGIAAAGGNPAADQSAGANVGMNIDNMSIYSYAAAESFGFAKTEYEVVAGKTINTMWKLTPENAYLPYITYTSSDVAVARVNADGVVTGVAAGTAIITATPAPSTGLAPITATVVVKSSDDAADIANVAIKETNVAVKVGATTALTATVSPDNATVKGVSWYSCNPAVATVDQATGVVTGVSVGTTNIIVVTDDGGKMASVEVTVEAIYATSVIIYDGAEAAKVTAGKFVTLYATVAPAGAINKVLKWSSSDPAIAAVDPDTGVVSGVKKGVAVITATVDGTTITDTIAVLVTEPRTEACAGVVYENNMDALNATGSTLYPTGWERENEFAKASAVVTYGGRTYWQMKNDANGIPSSAYAIYTFVDGNGNEAPLTAIPVSLKYSVMVDNEGEGWLTELPSFTNAKRGRLFTFRIADNNLIAGNTTMPVQAGKWYDIEVVIDGAVWTVYVDGYEFASDTMKEAPTSLAYINTGIYAKKDAGNLAANIGLNIDDLTVHSHSECSYSTYKNISFEKTSYRFTTAGSFVPTLVNIPNGVSVSYVSSNEAVATVDALGKVTVTGTLGIAAIQAWVDGCILPVSTVMVNCAERFTYVENFENGLNGWGISIYCGNKDYQSIDTVNKPFAGNTSNNALALKAVAQSGLSMRAIYSFKDKMVLDRAVIRYDFMIDSNMGDVFLPGFVSGATGLVGELCVSYDSLKYMKDVDQWTDVGKTIVTDKWYTLEQVVDTVAGVYDLYIDGELVMAQVPMMYNSIPFNGVYAGMFRVCTNTQYIDNIYVAEGIDPITAIRFEHSNYVVAVGSSTTKLGVDLDYTGNAFRSVKYVSSDESVATVDAFGNITGHKDGTVTITAIPYGNPALSATTTVVVVEKPVTAIAANDVNLHVGGHMYLNPAIIPSDAGFNGLLYTSSNCAVATVDEWGEVVAVGKGTAQITITSEKYPSVKKTITVTVTEETYQGTIYVSVNGGGNGSSPNSPLTLQQAMDKVAGMDKSRGSIIVEMAGGYYQQTTALNFAPQHGGNNDNFVIYRAANGAEVTIGGAKTLDSEIVSGFTKVDGKGYYIMQLNKDINTRHLIVNGVRAVRARSNSGLTDPKVIYGDEKRLSALGFSCTDEFLLNIPADDHADLEFSYCVEWANHRGGAQTISKGEDGRVHIIMEQPNFQTLTGHSSLSVKELEDPSRPYSMFYENALVLLDEPGEWYFDNEEMKLYYMPYGWENVNNLTISYPVIDDWTKDGMDITDSGLVNIMGSDSGIVQNIKFEGISFADTTYSRTNSNLGFSATQGLHIRDFNSTSADIQPEAAITLLRTNSIYFTGCTFTRLGITGINMFSGAQNVQINGCIFSDISGNGMYIGETNWRKKEVYNPSDPLMVVKNCDVYNSYMHDMGTEYQSASAIAVGFAAYVNLENNEVFNVAYCPFHIGLGWFTDFENVLRHTTVANNFIHDFNFGGVWDSGAIYLNGKTSGTVDVNTGIGNNLIYGNFIKNMGVGTAALYADKGANNWIWENNVVDLHENMLWHNAWTPNSPQWVATFSSNSNMLFINNYTSVAKTYADYPRASGTPAKISGPYDENSLNDNIYGLAYKGNVVCEDLNWPTEARNIMANAGLQKAYSSLRNNHPERLLTDLPDVDEDTLVLGVGGISAINLRATDGKDVPVDLSGATISYLSSDESVVKVSSNGVITAVGKGDAVVYVQVMANGIVQKIERAVSVGTDLVDIYVDLADEQGVLNLSTRGDAVALTPKAVTERGIHLTPDAVKYEITDTSIARITEENTIRGRAEGETTLMITVTVSGQSYTKAFKLKVSKPVNFVLDDLEEVFKRSSISGWKNSFMKLSLEQDKELTIKGTGTGHTTFAPTKYLNELFCFEFALTKESEWPSFALRVHGEYSYVAAGATGYLICFETNGVQLQRFNRNERTVLYGDVDGFDSVYGGDIPFFLKEGQVYKIQVGALTNGGNVHLFLSVDGQVIFNCVDKDPEAITTAGYFGVVGKENDVFRLIKAQDLSAYSLPEMDFGSEDNYQDGVVAPPFTDSDGTDNPEGPNGSGNAGNNNNKPNGNNKPGQNSNGSGGTGSSNGQGLEALRNGWVLPVVIVSVLTVAAGILVWICVFLKKRKETLNEEPGEEDSSESIQQ